MIGNLHTAIRINNADERFIETCMTLGNVSRDIATKAMAAYKTAKLIKVDAVCGQMVVKTGQVYDHDILVEWAA